MIYVYNRQLKKPLAHRVIDQMVNVLAALGWVLFIAFLIWAL